jgi:hypothetical protein
MTDDTARVDPETLARFGTDLTESRPRFSLWGAYITIVQV